jgi:hypothetical protein
MPGQEALIFSAVCAHNENSNIKKIFWRKRNNDTFYDKNVTGINQ